MTTSPRPDLTRVVLALILIALLIGGSLFILQPFLPALVWATMIVVATWPLMRMAQARLRGSRALATALMLVAMLLVIVLPLSVAVTSLVGHADSLREQAQELSISDLPPPPQWLASLPVVGGKLAAEWQALKEGGAEGLRLRVAPYAKDATTWLAGRAGSLGMLGLHFLLTVAIAGILYMKGEAAADGVIRFARRLAGARGENSVHLAGQAIRAVAMGIVVTAIVQSLLGGIGLAICGVPAAAVLTALMFMLCIAQLGPVLVLAPAAAWLFWSGDALWGGVLVGFTLLAGSLDNVLRPYLIKRGADLPLLLILVGVIGGLLAFGFVGLFVGPVLLAVAYTLLDAWIDEGLSAEAEQDAAAA